MLNDLTLLWSWFVRLATSWLPDVALTMRLRGSLYGLAMKHCGKNFQVASRVTLSGLHRISVGDHVYLAPNAVLSASYEITLEDEVMVAFHTVITDGNHTKHHGSFRYGRRDGGRIVIGRGSWIGANATVLPGVTIGRGVVVGANAAVTRDLPDHSLAVGVPARVRSIDPLPDAAGFPLDDSRLALAEGVHSRCDSG